MSILEWFIPKAYAHVNDPALQAAIPTNIWWKWRLEGGVVLFLVGLAFAYYKALKAYKEECPEAVFPRKQFVLFLGGLFSIYIAIASPIDSVGEQYLFSIHMVQHNIFIYLVPWLLFLGLPNDFASHYYEKWQLDHPIIRFFHSPIVACLLFNLMFAVWHYPYLYEWALQDRMMHNLEHLTFIGFSLLMWMPLWSPVSRLRLPYGGQILYLVGLTIAQIPIFAFLTFSKRVLYPTYDTAARLTFMSALADQQLGGVIMKITAMIVMGAALIAVFRVWYLSEKEKDRHSDQVILASK